MNTDPRPFIAAAVSGMTSRPIHGTAVPNPDDPKGPPVVVNVALADHVAERAVEIGVAVALAFDRWQAKQDESEMVLGSTDAVAKVPKKR